MDPMPPPADAAQPAARSGWPTAVGVIAIVFGAIGLINGCFNVTVSVFAEWVVGLLEEVGQSAEAMGLAGMIEWKGWIIASALLSAAVAVPLVLGGVRLARRRRSARTILLVWAPVKILYVVGAAVVGYFVNEAQFEAMQDDPVTAGVGGEVTRIIGIVVTLATVIWGWALPVFVLIWFNRKTIAHEMGTWSDGNDALP